MTILSAIGWGIGVTALVITLTWIDMGSDAGAYWNAAARLLAGEPALHHRRP